MVSNSVVLGILTEAFSISKCYKSSTELKIVKILGLYMYIHLTKTCNDVGYEPLCTIPPPSPRTAESWLFFSCRYLYSVPQKCPQRKA